MMSDPQTTGRAPSRLARSVRGVVTSPGRRRWIGAAALIVLAFALLGRDDLALMVRSFGSADWRWALAAVALMLASLALRSLSLQLVVGIVAGLVAMSAQDMSLAELAGRSRQAAAALRAAEPKVPAAEGSAAP